MQISKRIQDFNNNAYSASQKSTTLSEKRIKKILNFVGSGHRILDVGCYDGTIAKRLEQNGNKVVGIDIAASAVKLAKSKKIDAYVWNLEEGDLPKKFGKFDVVVAGEIIEHIFDTDGFIRKIGKVLRPGGRLVMSTPNLACLGCRISLVIGKTPWMIKNGLEGLKSGHIRYFTIQTLTELLTKNGFVVGTMSSDSIGFGQSFTIPFLNNIFPQLGRVLVVVAQKNEI